MNQTTCPLGNVCGPSHCLVGIAIIAVFVILFIVARKKNWCCLGKQEKTAKEILDIQYAEGKIDKEEYEQKKKNLEK